MPPCSRSRRRSRRLAPSSRPTIDGRENGPSLRGGAPLFVVEQRQQIGAALGQFAVGVRRILDAGKDSRGDVLRGRGLFPADALRGGEQGRQIAPQLIGD